MRVVPNQSNSGQATKIDDSVPMMMPMICDSAMPRSAVPPKMYSASTVRNATNEVMMVRDSVWLTERFSTS